MSIYTCQWFEEKRRAEEKNGKERKRKNRIGEEKREEESEEKDNIGKKRRE